MTGLTAEGIRAGYQDRPVVDDVSFEVEPRSIFGLIGPNGSGKTTLFKCMCGLLRPFSGTIRLGGRTSPGSLGGGSPGWPRSSPRYTP